MSARVSEREWATARRLHRSTGMACPCRLTAIRCAAVDAPWSNAPFHEPLLARLKSDHASLWLDQSGRPSTWVSQPYGLDDEPLSALSAYAETHGLHPRIDAQPAWHYPGHVLHVELSRGNTAPAPPGTFSAWLAQHEHDRNARGHLARDAAGDLAWPEDPQGLDELLAYLSDLGACDGALDACRAAWRDWCAP